MIPNTFLIRESINLCICLQALHKISELVKNDESKNAKAVLSYWADFYYTLTTDIDHNVREAAQVCPSTHTFSKGSEPTSRGIRGEAETHAFVWHVQTFYRTIRIHNSHNHEIRT